MNMLSAGFNVAVFTDIEVEGFNTLAAQKLKSGVGGSIHKQLTWVLMEREFRLIAKEQRFQLTNYYSTLRGAPRVKIFRVHQACYNAKGYD